MPAEFDAVFTTLKPVLGKYASRLAVKTDTAREYSVVGKKPSPFPQHKGNPMWFACLRKGKAYVSFHLLPLYMNPALQKEVTPALKKRMQGKACFNFKTEPDAELLSDLKELTSAAYKNWTEKKWL